MFQVNPLYLATIIAVGFAVLFIILYKSEKKFVSVEINGTKINAELADNFAKQSVGLMFRSSLGKNDGMLFIFSREDYYNFWMANVKFPLDIIWIGKNKTVVDVTENVQPCGIICLTFTSKEKSQYVLEVNAGFAKQNKIKVGDKASF